jgi:hypothetical protein
MSLIQEALKRKAQEQGEEPPENPAVPPTPEPSQPEPAQSVPLNDTSPPPIPLKSSADNKPSPLRIALIFLLIIGLITALALIGFYLLQSSAKPNPNTPPPEPAAPAEPQSLPGKLIQKAEQAVAEHDTAQPPAGEPGPAQPDPTSSEPETEATSKPEPQPEQTTAEPKDSSPVSLLEKVLKKGTADVQKAVPLKPPVKWPRLKVSGAASNEDGGIAFINGKMVRPGARIEDVLIVEIRQTEVVAEYKGDRRILRVGDE